MTRRLMFDSSRLFVLLQRNKAFGVTTPRVNESEESSVSLVTLSELIENELFDVPEIVVDAAEILFTLILPA